MAEKDVKQMAREILAAKWYGTNENAVDALAAASLLHDPAEVARGKEALEACVKYAERYANAAWLSNQSIGVINAGRAELERRKPVPYCHVAVSVSAPTFRVIRKCDLAVLADHLTESQARDVMTVLNKRAEENAK